MYYIVPYWTEPCYRASVNGLLVCMAKAYCIDYLTGKVSRLLVDP